MCPASNIRRIYAKIVQTSGNKKESAKRFAISCPSTVHPHKKPTNQSCDRQTSEIVTRHHTNLSPLHLPTYHPNSDKLPYRTHCNITFINSVKDHKNAQHSIPCKRPHSDTSRRRKNVRTTRSFTTSHGSTTTGLAVVDPWDVVARPRPVFSVFSANFATSA